MHAASSAACIVSRSIAGAPIPPDLNPFESRFAAVSAHGTRRVHRVS